MLVMTKAGPTLMDLVYQMKNYKFSMQTICKIAMQAVSHPFIARKSWKQDEKSVSFHEIIIEFRKFQIRIFQYIHSKGLLFVDVKPENIAIGNTDANRIVFFDFAFSEFYVNALGEPKRREESSAFNGTPEYWPLGPLNGLTHVRKDDLIAFGIVLLELNGADIPWMDKTNDDDDMYTTMDIVLEEWEKHGIEVS